jgi:NADH-quinone oxidoreductase subunit C
MSIEAVVENLKGKFAASILEVAEYRGETTVIVKKEEIVAICSYLKMSEGFNFLSDLCGVDYLGKKDDRFMVVYNLYNISTHARLRLKVAVAEKDATVDSVASVWGTANWHERECWDLLGISFNNHPDLRRILMPADWVGHPLRKDYPVQGPDRAPYQGGLS